MELSTEAVVGALAARSDYQNDFDSAFPGQGGITLGRTAASLAAYVRTLHSGNSSFDQFRFGANVDALSAGARRGMFLFLGKAGCAGCHQTAQYDALFTDNEVHNTGIGFKSEQRRARRDFLTPGLRNVALTAPYMHDGSLQTLEEVVAYYNRGGNPDPELDARIRALHLTARERADLVDFLKKLTTTFPQEQTAENGRKGAW